MKNNEKFQLAPMGVLAHGSAHARPSAWPHIGPSRNFPARVSAEWPPNISKGKNAYNRPAPVQGGYIPFSPLFCQNMVKAKKARVQATWFYWFYCGVPEFFSLPMES